jgi:hypothetical protein
MALHTLRLEHYRKAVDININCQTPLMHFKYSFFSGSSLEGLKQSFSQFKHASFYHTPSRLVIPTVMNVFHTLLHDIPFKPPAPEISGRVFRGLGYDPTRSAGINLFETGRVDNGAYIIEYTQQGAKAGVLEAIVCEMDRVYAAWLANPDDNGEAFRQSLCSLFVKSELFGPGKDPKKTRLIFPVNHFKYSVDRCIYERIFKDLYSAHGIMIGWSRANGGMQQLYDDFSRPETAWLGRKARIPSTFCVAGSGPATDPIPYFVLEADFQKLDFSMIPSLLCIILMLPLLYYDPNSYWYPFMAYMCEHSVNQTVTKILHIARGMDYMVIGQMFSGEYVTSFGDSLYVLVCMKAWEMFVHEQLVADGSVFAEHWKTHVIRRRIYGDDILAKYPAYVYKYLTGVDWDARSINDKPRAMSEWMKKNLHVNLKIDESYVFFATTGRPDPMLTIIDRSNGTVLQRGPKILQRYFVNVKLDVNYLRAAGIIYKGREGWIRSIDQIAIRDEFIGPFRDIWPYYTKASAAKDVLTHLMRLRGLKVDTSGTNPAAWDFLSNCEVEICKQYKIDDIDEALEVLDPSHEAWSELHKRLMLSGLTGSYVKGEPCQAELVAGMAPPLSFSVDDRFVSGVGGYQGRVITDHSLDPMNTFVVRSDSKLLKRNYHPSLTARLAAAPAADNGIAA